MFMRKDCLFFLLLAVCHTVINVAGDSSKCPGGYAEGTTIDLGSYWYECQGGQIVPKGCLTENHMRIEIKETYDVDEFRMQCVLDSAGQLTMTYKSCVQGGQEHQPGGTWDNGKSWFTCEKVSTYLRVEASGCVDGGRRLALDEKVEKGDIVYQCKKNSQGTPTLTQWGCVANGKQYGIGDKFDQDATVYQCTSKDGKVQAKCIGCVHESRHLSASDRFVKEDVIYECNVEEDKTNFKPSGCIQRDERGTKVERKLGCYWIEGSPPFQYQMTCQHDDNAVTAVKTVVKCVYKVTQGTIVVAPGCYSIVDKTAVACIRDSSGNVNMRSFQVDDNGNVNVPGGVSQC